MDKDTDLLLKNNILNLLFESMPYVFWKGIDGKYRGANMNQATNLGFHSPDEFIDKSIFEILEDVESAKTVEAIDNQIMQEGICMLKEEKIRTRNGEKTYLSKKIPIHNASKKVIGMLGYSVDITELKMKEMIAEKKQKTLAQVSHDIRSPLASLMMILQGCQNIPEKERIALREIAITINDIANNLLVQHHITNPDPAAEGVRPVLVSELLMQVLTDKRYQYQNRNVQLVPHFNPEHLFVFIHINPTTLKRALSNLINNAVESLGNGNGAKVTVALDVIHHSAVIQVIDNGKGMSEELLEKIRQQKAVTEGKTNGHGIGLTQVRETVAAYGGELQFSSTKGIGSTVTLSFPLVAPPLLACRCNHSKVR